MKNILLKWVHLPALSIFYIMNKDSYVLKYYKLGFSFSKKYSNGKPSSDLFMFKTTLTSIPSVDKPSAIFDQQ